MAAVSGSAGVGRLGLQFSTVAVANFVTIASEEVARLGLSNTLVEEEELAAARARYIASTATPAPDQNKAAHEAAVTAAVSDAVLFNELDPLLDEVRGDDAPQIAQEAQEQAPETEEVSETPVAAEEPKPGRRGR